MYMYMHMHTRLPGIHVLCMYMYMHYTGGTHGVHNAVLVSYSALSTYFAFKYATTFSHKAYIQCQKRDDGVCHRVYGTYSNTLKVSIEEFDTGLLH